MNKLKTIGGHIFGKDLTEIRFVYDSVQPNGEPTPIENGEILTIVDRRTNERYLVRVTNIEYGQKAEWAKLIARGLNLQNNVDLSDEHENPGEIYRPDNRDQLYMEAVCELLGYVNKEDKFMSPKRLPSYFSYTRKLEEEDLEADSLRQGFGDITFGCLRSGSQVLHNVRTGFFKKLLPYHIGIFAATGGGKSNTMKVIAGEIMKLEGAAGMLLFEPHGEYIQDLKKHPYAKEQLICFDQDGANNNQKLIISYSDVTVDILMNVRQQLNLTEPQERFMREAESKFGQRKWFYQVLSLPVTEEDAVLNNIAHITTLKQEFPNTFEDTIRATQSKLKSRIGDAKYLNPDPTVSNIPEILKHLDQGKVVLIDMVSLTGLHELLLSTILASKVLSARRKLYTKDRAKLEKMPPAVIVMEEAQRVLGKNTNTDVGIFAQIVNEGRKFMTGLLTITQQPKLMDPVLLSQFNTLIILSISDEQDFDVLKGKAKKPISKLGIEISTLMPGEAIVTTPLSPFAVPMKVDFWDDHVKEAKKTYKKRDKGVSLGIDEFKGFM